MIPESLSALAGQVLLAGFPEGPLPDGLRDLSQRGELGGFILFRRNLFATSPDAVERISEQNAELIAACSIGSAPPPVIAIDQEGGRVQRLSAPVLQLPPMRKLGMLDDTALTFECARVLGAQLAVLGVSLDFAPVLDVDSNEANPVIGDRSFSRDPEAVARHGEAFARGLLASGIAACGKHFPGHGDTDLDSHLALPRVRHGMPRLEAVELLPFAHAHAALPSVMTAHVVFDAIDPSHPATLTPLVLRILRERIGYAGLIVSDDLEMRAVADGYGIGEAACMAIAAGCDALLVCSDPERCALAHEALTHRAEIDGTFRERLRDAVTRCYALRTQYPPRPKPAALARALLTSLAAALEPRLADALATLA